VPVVAGPPIAAAPACPPAPPYNWATVPGEAVRSCGSVAGRGSVVNSPVCSRVAAPAGNDNSVSELPKRPSGEDSQITTARISPTAIFSSGGGR